MNNKGYTLIELLGVIVILAILSSIAIVSYNGIITNVKDSQYNNLITQITIETKHYIEDNSIENGYILVDDLISNNYISEDEENILYDPRNKDAKLNCLVLKVTDSEVAFDEDYKKSVPINQNCFNEISKDIKISFICDNETCNENKVYDKNFLFNINLNENINNAFVKYTSTSGKEFTFEGVNDFTTTEIQITALNIKTDLTYYVEVINNYGLANEIKYKNNITFMINGN